jgi:hypothetical protein
MTNARAEAERVASDSLLALGKFVKIPIIAGNGARVSADGRRLEFCTN